MAAAAIPAASMAISYFANKGKKKAQNAATAQMEQANKTATQLAGRVSGLDAAGATASAEGRGAVGQGTSMLGQAAGYYAPILAGNRGALTEATAPERGLISDYYRGASKSLDRAGVRGAGRDTAEAEIARDRAGKLAGTTAGIRGQAAQALGMLGGQQQQTGLNLQQLGYGYRGAGSQALGDAGRLQLGGTGIAQGRADTERQYSSAAGAATGSMLFDALKSGQGKKAGGAGGGTAAPAFGGLPTFAPTVPMNRPY